MKVKTYNCPDCGASLTINEKTKHVFCEYCGGQVSIKHTGKIVKDLYGDISEEQEYIDAKNDLEAKNYTGAYKGYKSLSKRYSNDPIVWIGLLRSCSNDFTREVYEFYYLSEIEKFWENFCSLAIPEEIEKYKKQYEEHHTQVTRICEAIKKTEEENLNKRTIKYQYENHLLLKLIITIALGPLGVHKFIEGKPELGVLYFISGGLLGVGWIIDIIKVVMEFIKKIKVDK